jgi:hypothetical protein
MRWTNPIWIWIGGIAVAVLAVVFVVFAVRQHEAWSRNCREVLHGAVQTQTWSGYGYGYHTDSSGNMVYGYYSTSTTVCRLVSGPNAGVIIDTE